MPKRIPAIHMLANEANGRWENLRERTSDDIPFSSMRATVNVPIEAEQPNPLNSAADCPFLRRRPRGLANTDWLRFIRAHAKVWMILALLFVITGAVTCAWLLMRRPVPLSRKDVAIAVRDRDTLADLGMRVEAKGQVLMISWNGRSAVMQSARSAVFEISDGGHKRLIHLDPREIANGSVLYQPESSDVALRLNISGPEGWRGSESVRVLNGSKLRHSLNLFANSGTSVLRTAQRNRANGQHQQRTATAARLGNTGRQAIRPASSRTLVPKAAAKLDGNAAALRTSSRAARVPTRARPVYVPPQPVKQAMPAGVPGSWLIAPVDIAVEVSIDETGWVIEARLAGGASNINESLARSAVTAAWEWIFRPATMDGKAVSSRHTIVFRFNPESH